VDADVLLNVPMVAPEGLTRQVDDAFAAAAQTYDAQKQVRMVFAQSA
jgi:hypothetical protein